MSYISRAELRRDETGQRAIMRLLLADARQDAHHRLVWTLFGDDPAAPRDFLYRATDDGRYLIVSMRPPHPASDLWRVETKPYAPVFRRDARWAFQLRANPIRSVRGEAWARGRRRAVMSRAVSQDPEARRAAALDWLVTRCERHGASVSPADCVFEHLRALSVGRGSEGRLQTVDFRGVLTVTDPTRLSQAATEGIGRAKAYGCGLLLLRPLGADPGAAP